MMKSAKKAIKEILENAGINDEERHTNVFVVLQDC